MSLKYRHIILRLCCPPSSRKFNLMVSTQHKILSLSHHCQTSSGLCVYYATSYKCQANLTWLAHTSISRNIINVIVALAMNATCIYPLYLAYKNKKDHVWAKPSLSKPQLLLWINPIQFSKLPSFVQQ